MEHNMEELVDMTQLALQPSSGVTLMLFFRIIEEEFYPSYV